MKCKLCGAKVLRKNDHCTQCGAKIMRNPHALRKLMFKLFMLLILLILLVILFIVSLLIYDKVHRSKALLPGLYTGMTKHEMLATLHDSYPQFYDGKQMENSRSEEWQDSMSYVAYTEYSNALGLNRAMEFEASFYSVGDEQYLDSYSISMPYISAAGNSDSDKVIAHDIQTKILPILTERYGTAETAGGEYEYVRHFNLKETVQAYDTKISQLLGFKDALFNEFKNYGSMNACITISYEGFSSSKLRKFWFG